jgi:hypothetical protein
MHPEDLYFFVCEYADQGNHAQDSRRDKLKWQLRTISFETIAPAHEVRRESDYPATCPEDG